MTNAEVWMSRAREYRDASQIVPAGNAKVFLTLHGVELLLKARLFQTTEEPGNLQKSHDFAALMRAIGVDPAGYANLVAADPAMTRFRYPRTPAGGTVDLPAPRSALDLNAILAEADALWEEIGGPQ